MMSTLSTPFTSEFSPAISVTIPAIAPSANSFYSGMHPMARKRLADWWHQMVSCVVKQEKIRPYAGTYPVDVECRCFFGKGERLTDADNCSPTAKLVIDGLVRAGILENDSPRFVRSVRLIPGRSENGSSYTVITIS